MEVMRYNIKTSGFKILHLFLFLTLIVLPFSLFGATPLAKNQNLKTGKVLVKIDKTKYKSLQKFAQILHLVEREYIKNKNINELVQFSIKGLLSRLDPHSQHFSAQEYKDFKLENNGNFAGIGVELAYKKSHFIVLSVAEGNPAKKIGVKAGDILFQINGRSVSDFSMSDLSKNIRGKVGSLLNISILRGKDKKVFKFSIRRKIIKIHNIKAITLSEGYKYIQVRSFARGIAKEVRKILKKSYTKNKKLKGLILDLRFNPGGLLYEAVQLSDLFLNKGIIVQVLGRDKKAKEVLKAQELNTYSKVKLIVLINAYSASASEIVAAALQDNKRALIMGQTSFGKGSVQGFFPLEGGGAVKLTIAQYYTPSGESIQTRGVIPNIHIRPVDEKLLKKAVLTNKPLFSEASLVSALKKQNNLGKQSSKDPSIEFNFFSLSKCKMKKYKKYKKACKLLNKDFSVLQAFNYLKVLDSL